MIIHYFASVREQLGKEKEEINDSFHSVSDLIEYLSNRSEIWKTTLHSEQTLVAVNQVMAQRDATLEPDSEVAFFPFMTGG